MQLREEIEPNLDFAERLYPEVLSRVLAYTAYVDENGDEENIEYKNVEAKLQHLTGKDMSNYDLWEYWEGESAEVFAFRIALPYPQKIDNITKEELTEIVRRIVHFEEPEKKWDELTFKEQWSLYLDDYYHNFLKLNFRNYNYQKVFGQQKDSSKNSFWWNKEEIVELLWAKK